MIATAFTYNFVRTFRIMRYIEYSRVGCRTHCWYLCYCNNFCSRSDMTLYWRRNQWIMCSCYHSYCFWWSVSSTLCLSRFSQKAGPRTCPMLWKVRTTIGACSGFSLWFLWISGTFLLDYLFRFSCFSIKERFALGVHFLNFLIAQCSIGVF